MKQMKHYVMILIIFMLLVGCVAAPVSSGNNMADSSQTEANTTLTHTLGETEISGVPERVVALEWTYVENLLALGIQPAGVADIEGYHNWVKIPVALADDVIDVGTRQAPNLELLAELKPDLIIAPSFRVAEIYDELSEIAPTLAFNAYPTDETVTQYTEMRETFMAIASVVGREEAGEAVLADMDAHFAAAQTQLDAADVVSESFTLAQAFGQDTVSIRLFTDNAMAVEIVEQIGLENSWEDAEFQQYGFTTVGVETLPELGDLNFFYVVQDDNNVFERETVQPVWESLEFVQNGNAYPLGGDTWLFGGPLSAVVLVDLVVEKLTGQAVMRSDMAAASDSDATFPVTIEHKFGSTEIESEPLRVVSLGYSEQDAILGLGVTPIAVRDWFGDQPFGVWPWSQDLLGNAEPTLLQMPYGELNFEQLAALQPDIFIATHSGITEEEYNILSEIAPVLAQSGEVDDFGMSWQEQTMSIGQALGREAQAEALVAEVEAKIAAAADVAFNEATIAWITPAEGGEFWAVGDHTPPFRFFAALGLGSSPEVAEEIGELSSVKISSERLDMVDATVLVVRAPTEGALEEIKSNEIYQQLDVVKDNRVIYFVGNDPIYGALSFSTVLSLPYVVDELVPQISEAVQ